MSDRHPAGERGGTLAGLVAALAIAALLAGLAAAQLRPAGRRQAAVSAARDLAGRIRRLSRSALADGRDRALLFPLAGGDEPIVSAADADGDGVHRDDLRSGADPVIDRFTLARDHPGTRIGKPERTLPALPPSAGTIGADDPAVRFGSRRVLALTAAGHATPGSVFVTAGERTVCAVVVHGAAIRVRVLCLDGAGRSWRER